MKRGKNELRKLMAVVGNSFFKQTRTGKFFKRLSAMLGEISNFRIPGHFIYICRCALKNEVYNNNCYSYLMTCKWSWNLAFKLGLNLSLHLFKGNQFFPFLHLGWWINAFADYTEFDVDNNFSGEYQTMIKLILCFIYRVFTKALNSTIANNWKQISIRYRLEDCFI